MHTVNSINYRYKMYVELNQNVLIHTDSSLILLLRNHNILNQNQDVEQVEINNDISNTK